VLAALGWYNPIQSLEVGDPIPFHADVKVPPAVVAAGLALRVGVATVIVAAGAEVVVVLVTLGVEVTVTVWAPVPKTGGAAVPDVVAVMEED
jgi:hypothetical protein